MASIPSVGSSFSGPDAAGRGTIVLNDAAVGGTLQYAYYVVGPEAFRLIETDGIAFAAGSMYGQGSGAGSFTAASLTGSFVFGNSGRAAGGLGISAEAGQFTTDGSAALTSGVADANLGDGMPVLAGDLTGGAYSIGANGYGGIALSGSTTDGIANFGVYLTDPAINLADPNNTSGGGGAVMLDLDVNSLGAGIVPPQVAGATAPGNLAFNQDGIYVNATTGTPFDLVGQVLSDGSSAFSGLADFNDLFNTELNPGVTVSGTITADSANPGRSTVVLTVNGSATPKQYHCLPGKQCSSTAC